MEKFRRKMGELDGRLGSVIKGCILNCSSVKSMTKVLQVYEFLMRRPAIREVALSICEKSILDTARQEMDSLLRKFLEDATRDSAAHLSVYQTIPPTSRVIQWVWDIRGQLDEILKAVNNVSHLFISKKSIQTMETKHEKLSTKFMNFADDVFNQWSDSIPDLLKDKLHQPLILETVIREVKHLIRLRSQSCIPEDALSFYQKRDQLGDQRILLKSIVDCYNELRAELLPIEAPLVQPMLHKMDALLLPGETSVIWSDSGVSEYLQRVEVSSQAIHGQVQAAKKNLREIQDLCYAWGNNEPLLCEMTLPLDLATVKTGESLVDDKLKPMVLEDGKRIHSLLQESKELFGVSTASEEWSKYVSFVDELVSEGLLYLLRRNLYFLLQATTPESGQSPVFMIHVHLDTFGLRFKPPLDKPKHKTLLTLMDGIVAGIFSVTGLVQRVDDAQSSKAYMSELEELQELQDMREELSSRIQSLSRDAEEVLLDLQPYSYLWKEEP
ncbi:dynein beta chain, ciliary [Caerostris darwini]|uniref:Dynein beta chain, ciliary n=1 Tax=Caerostris darwini TaxID=1538125 RepID=A0AAV4SVI0_9ARAC|nr:dynein beta chain, ciliary [Caerostris darwini]